jgi:hypothetical protein
MAKLLLNPMLPLLPSDRMIIRPVYNNVALYILQGVLKTRAYAPLNGKWADLECLLWDLEPNPSPFLGTKDQVILLLNFHGGYNLVEVQIPPLLQSLAKSIKDKMEAVESGRIAAADAEHLNLKAHASKNVCQEGTLSALPWAYGVDAPRVAGVSHASEHQNQHACSLLAQNPHSKNSHACPIAAVALPAAADVPGFPPIPPIFCKPCCPACECTSAA